MIKRAGLLAVAFLLAGSVPALAKNVDLTETQGPYRVELEVLPPEAFCFPGETVAAGSPHRMFMLYVGGAAPLLLNAASHPNHHLIVHVFDAKTGRADARARVRMSLRRLDAAGHGVGKAEPIPVVVMRVKGRGSATTHYGNNVHLDPGRYRVRVDVNGRAFAYTFTV